ncbi:flavin reductase family protein, partial [Duncaniella muris]|uniref:flavin reductase family protein n=1 Tax=Duncaniella muris TaxID=2094150 RepID=UPI0025B54090
RSGADYDKWEETGLTPEPGVKVSCPSIAESPLSIECRVKEVVHLGSHDMFVADVVNVLADEKFMDPSTGAFDLARAGLMAYSHGGYYELGRCLGRFGWSVKGQKKR